MRKPIFLVCLSILACSEGGFKDRPGPNGRAANGAPVVRIVSPASDSTVSGVVEIAIEASAAARPMTLSLSVDGQEMASFEELSDAFHINSANFANGSHDITIALTDAENREAHDAVQVVVDNAPFQLVRVSAAQQEVLRGTEVQIEAQYSSPGLTVQADFSAIDDGYRTGSETVETLSNNFFRIRYVISQNNTRAQGRYPIALQARDTTGKTQTTQAISLTLLAAPRAPFQIDEAAFLLANTPATTPGTDTPTATITQGSTSIITGGTAQMDISITDPQGAGDITHAVVRVQGFSGHYLMPIFATNGIDPDDNGGRREGASQDLLHDDFQLNLFLPSATGLPNGFPFTLELAVVDHVGHVSAFVTHVIQLVQVLTGDVQVSLSWDSPTDMDLHVIEPSGEEILYNHRTSATGGQLDLDSNPSCTIDGVNNENVAWPVGQAPSGEYSVRADYWSDCGGQSATGRVTVQVCGQVTTYNTFSNGQPLAFGGGTADRGGAGSGIEVARFVNRCGNRATGRVRYEHKDMLTAMITVLDLPHAPIEVRDHESGEVVGRALTNHAGEFTVAYESHEGATYDLFVVATRGGATEADQSVAITHDQEQIYEHRLTATPLENNQGQTDIGIQTIAVGQNSGAFHILTVISQGIDFLFGRVPLFRESRLAPRLVVLWEPETANDEGTFRSKYDPISFLLQIAGRARDADEFDDHVILHEFGHHVMRLFSKDSSPGGQHGFGTPADPRLAWSEGLATFYASAVLGDPLRRNFDRGVVKIVDLERGQRLVDGEQRADSAYGTSDGTMTGLVNELLVSAVLWDLLDATNSADPDFDNIENLSADKISHVLFSHLVLVSLRANDGIDLVDFLDGWLCQGFSSNEELALLLSDTVSSEHRGRNFPYDFGYQSVCQ